MRPNTVMKQGIWRHQETPLTQEQVEVAVHIGIGWMVPDSRLQDIAEVCRGTDGKAQWGLRWLKGNWPEMYATLTALTQEDNDE